MPSDSSFVRKGSTVPLDGLLDQGRVSQKLATDHAPALAPWGFGPAEAAGFAPLLERLGSDAARTTDSRANSKQNTVTEREALARAKKWKRLVISAANTLVKKKKMPATDRSALNAGDELENNTTKYSAYLGKVQAVIAKYNDALKPLVGGMDPAAELAAAKSALDTAQSIQETGVAALPLETQQIYEAKGQLLELIEDLNAAAARAFDGDAPKKALFNKDLILRAVQSRKAAPPPA